MLSSAAIMIGLSTFSNVGTVYAESGTERKWDSTLPRNHENLYYKFQKKETNEKKGYVEVKSMDTSGISVWFDTGEDLKTVQMITKVVKFKSCTKKDIEYQSHSKKGNNVALVMEDSESPTYFRNHATGIVNYK